MEYNEIVLSIGAAFMIGFMVGVFTLLIAQYQEENKSISEIIKNWIPQKDRWRLHELIDQDGEYYYILENRRLKYKREFDTLDNAVMEKERLVYKKQIKI